MLKGLRPSRLSRNGFTALHFASYKVRSQEGHLPWELKAFMKMSDFKSMNWFYSCLTSGKVSSLYFPTRWSASCINKAQFVVYCVPTILVVQPQLCSLLGQCRRSYCLTPWRGRHPAGRLWSPHCPAHSYCSWAPWGGHHPIPGTRIQFHAAVDAHNFFLNVIKLLSHTLGFGSNDTFPV